MYKLFKLFYKETLFKRAIILILCISIAVTASSCEQQCICRLAEKKADNPVNSNIQTTNELVLYMDISKSMRGYILLANKSYLAEDARGKSIYSKSLLDLYDVVSSINPPINVNYRSVDANVNAVGSVSDLKKAAIDQSIYTGDETNIAGAIKAFSTSLPNQNEKTALFHVLVTDGVQSKKDNFDNGSEECSRGTDPAACVKRQIINLLNNGWSGTVLGIKSEFSGRIPSEIQVGTGIDYSSTKENVDTYRPFYIYIFSPDQTALAKFTEQLKARYKNYLPNEDFIKEYPLTGKFSKGAAQGTLEVSAENDERKKLMVKIKPEQKQADETQHFSVTIDQSLRNEAMLEFKINPSWSEIARESDTDEELLKMTTWFLEPVDGSTTEKYLYPELKLIDNKINANGKLKLTLTWQNRTGNPGCRVYRLFGKIDLKNETPIWVKDWSTELDTTPESANKTLDLTSSLASLWNNSAIENQVIAEYQIWVGEEFPTYSIKQK